MCDFLKAIFAAALANFLTTPRASEFLPPLSSVQFPVQYISDGPDLRGPLKNDGETGSADCRAALCVETIGRGNDSWRLPVDLSAPVPFEAVSQLKMSFVRHGNAYRPIAKLRVVSLRPFIDSVRAATHIGIVDGFLKTTKSQVGDDVNLGVQKISSENYFYGFGVGFTNQFKFYVYRDGVYQKWECNSSSLLYSVCLDVEIAYSQPLVSPINESFVLNYSATYKILNGRFSPDVNVYITDVTPGIEKTISGFVERFSDRVRTAVLAAATPAAERMNETLARQRADALRIDGSSTLGLDLQWQLVSYGFVPFKQASQFPVLEAGRSADVIEPTQDLYPCQEVAPSFDQGGIMPSSDFSSRLYPPGKAPPLRLPTPLIDVHSEPFALDMNFEGAALPPAVARALHSKIRQSIPELNAWWVQSNALCNQLLEGNLQPLPPPFDLSKCPTTNNDAEPIPPECAGPK